MSGSSLDGLDVVFVEFNENGGRWSFEIQAADCLPYDDRWLNRLKCATSLNALDYLLLDAQYGHYLGEQVNSFIQSNGLEFRVALVASHGHTTFHVPGSRLTAQIGDGAAIAAVTGLPVVNQLRAMDVALGGQGAPIVPIGEKILFPGHAYLLNLGGIANISVVDAASGNYTAFDVCPANRVLNLLSADVGKEYDEDGMMASTGEVRQDLLAQLNDLSYYQRPGPKSLGNEFGDEVVYPLIVKAGYSVYDSLATYCEHIALQLSIALNVSALPEAGDAATPTMLVTGGGAFNLFLVERLKAILQTVEIVIPGNTIVKYKEALIMALIGVLRWREETNVLSSVTGASRDSVGGAFWMGMEG